MVAIEDALWENGGELTPELDEAMTANSFEIATKIDGYCALIRKFETAENSIDAEIKRLQALKKTATNSKEKLKDYMLYSMQTNGIDKLNGSLCKASLRRSEKTITDDELILAPYQFALEEFRRTLPEYVTIGDFKVNKTIIKDMAKKGGILPAGAEIQENWSVVLR